MPLSCDRCRCVFQSAADWARHKKLTHDATPATNAPKQHLCGYGDGAERCTLAFSTYYALLKHKGQAGHKSARGRPKKK